MPLAKGVDLRTRARLVDPSQLLVAENSSFPVTAGVAKRYGHSSARARTATALPAQSSISPVASGLAWSEPYAEKTLPSNWLYGWGLFDPNSAVASPIYEFTVSPHPDTGILCGAATRDSEELVWDGFRLLSVPRGQTVTPPFGEATKSQSHASLQAPAARTTPVAKGASSQTQSGLADNGLIKVVTWLEDGAPRASVYDSRTGGPLRLRVNPATDSGLTVTAGMIRCVPVGNWVWILLTDTGAQKLYAIGVQGTSPTTAMTAKDLGSCNGSFDSRKISETNWAVVIQDTSNNAVITYLDANGAAQSSPVPQRTTLVTGNVGLVSFDVHPQTAHVGLCWKDTSANKPKVQVFSQDGSSAMAATLLANDNPTRVTIAASYILSGAGNPLFFAYFDSAALSSGGGPTGQGVSCSSFTLSGILNNFKGFNQYLASQAFRVGQYPVCFTTFKSAFQTTLLLQDQTLLPVGRFEYGTAYATTTADGWLMGVNHLATVPAKDRLVFHTALLYNLRLDSTTLKALVPGTPASTAVFAETSIKEVRLDFLPRLRSAQAGRCVYFAGAQLWCYDGTRATEAGFHFGPENSLVTLVSSNSGGGGLVPGAKYRYYIQLCHRNAQGEEVRGPGFLTQEVTIGGGHNSVVVNYKYLPTRRTDAYFLVYRNENNGTLWYLTSSRDPASLSCPKNSNTTGLAFSDTTSDAALISNELAPANPSGYLETHTAPACELVASGKDRLWVAGGELPAGTVAPSRLFYPSQAPSFNAGLQITVDRGPDQISAIGFVDTAALLFRRDHTYVLEGDGTDNLSTGSWPAPRLALSEVGAISQEGLGLVPQGLAFQSPAGFRIVGPGGALLPFGLNVDPLAKGAQISACVVVPDDQQIRFYSPSGPALVYDYLQQSWTTWTGVECWGAVKTPAQRRVTLAKPTGDVWFETEGLYSDAGQTYRHKIRTAWLRGGGLGSWQRVRRVGFLGELPGGHFTLTLGLYYDEGDFLTETRTWDTSTDLNTSTWGTGNWGAGVWGDAVVYAPIQSMRDRILRATFGTARQKCAVVSVELDDGSCDGPGFVGNAILLEVGAKGGLLKVPDRTSTQTSFVPNTGSNNPPNSSGGSMV